MKDTVTMLCDHFIVASRHEPERTNIYLLKIGIKPNNNRIANIKVYCQSNRMA